MKIYINEDDPISPNQVIITSKFWYKFIVFLKKIGLKRKYNDSTILTARKALKDPGYTRIQTESHIKHLMKISQYPLKNKNASLH